MDFRQLKENNIQKILIGIGIVIVIVSMISFLEQIPHVASPRSTMYDKSFIETMNQLSNSLPDNTVLITSAEATPVTYFTSHTAKVPSGVSSKESLIDYMEKGDYNYLVVFDGKSSDIQLKSLFTSEGLKSLDNDFQLIATYCTDFSKIRLFQLNRDGINEGSQSVDDFWQTYTICQADAGDYGTPDISTINTIQIRIADDGTGPISVLLGGLYLIDENGKEILITDFQSGHGFRKVSGSGTQVDHITDFAIGTQSLKLETDGNGSAVFTRKINISPSIDFTDKHLKLWVKISDTSKLSEFRVTVTNDSFVNYRNYWIKTPPKV